MAECVHGSSMPDNLVNRLHDSQAGAGRHKCAICAYAAGLAYSGTPLTVDTTCAVGSTAPEAILDGLPDSQAYPARHLCCNCAFELGLQNRTP